MTLTVVLPAALPGIVSGCLLAVARGAGETAPLLFTILTVTQANRNVFHGPNTALATQIFSNATQPYPGAEATRLGRRAHSHRDRLYPDDRGANYHGPVHPSGAIGTTWNRRTVRARGRHEPMGRRGDHSRAGGDPGRTHGVRRGGRLDLLRHASRQSRTSSLKIYKNEITAFIGPSGCGKTTVLRTLNRMNDLVPGARVEGDVRYHGVSLYGPKVSPIAVRRRIGMVFQKPNPFPKSIFDNVAYGPRINGERNKGKLKEIVERSLRQAAPLGRGQGPARQVGPRLVRRASAAAVHCPHPGRRARGRPDGRALFGARSRSRRAPSRNS